MRLKNIAVVGDLNKQPSGNVGSAIIKALLKDGHFQVTAVIRPTSKHSLPPTSSASNNDDISIVKADFEDSSSLVAALRDQDAVVCCVPGGATKFGPQKLLIDAAIEAGVKLFFASEFASDILSPHYALFPTELVGDKIRVRKYLEEKASAGEIAYTALNGGPFFDMWLMRGFAGFDIRAHKARIYGTGNNLACWTSVPTVAEAAITMLRQPDPILNRAIFISGVLDLTQNAILAALEDISNNNRPRKKIYEVEHVDLKPIKEHALAALARGDYRQATMGLTLNSNFNEQDSAANFWHRVENELLGVQPVSVSEAIRRAFKDYGFTPE